MIRGIAADQAALDRIRKELRIDAVISDQRFGVRSAHVPSVLITHQVFPITPIAQGLLRKLNRWHIDRFDRCWIMDESDAPGLAGELSHGEALPTHARHIGTMSRLKPSNGATGRRYEVVAVVSGPEPQRTMLERRIIDQLQHIPGEHLLVLGRPDQQRHERIGNVEVRGHLNSAALADAMRAARLIVSRSGYTTLMDLVALDRSALLFPTPGQPEQEYLAKLHATTGRFIFQTQSELDIATALGVKPSKHSSGTQPSDKLLERALEDLAALLR
jgi:predicted glycosyltransferase